MPVMCKQCGVRPAKVHFTEIINNSMVQMELCAECAEAKGIDVQPESNYGLGDLVAGLIETTAQTGADKVTRVQCPRCGFEYSEFRKLGRLGCSECYHAFEGQLLPLLRQLHGGTQHQGKGPTDLGPKAALRRELVELKEKLARAIQKEAYEEAAKIRDRIRELEIKVDS